MFKDIITLNRNSRGCYILDTIKGCACVNQKTGGCYGDCYANRIASRYGMDFSIPIKRDFKKDNVQLLFDGFEDTKHESKIISEIEKIKMPFVRIGEMGDPSYDWKHTIQVCNKIKRAGKKIVIITKHWLDIPDSMLYDIGGIYINTSISALDSKQEISHRLRQFYRLKNYCNSILRVVTCDFNDNYMKSMQDYLLSIKPNIDTVFRPGNKNKYIIDGTINVKRCKFLKTTMLASMHKNDVYLGRCETCPDMCGINLIGGLNNA